MKWRWKSKGSCSREHCRWHKSQCKSCHLLFTVPYFLCTCVHRVCDLCYVRHVKNGKSKKKLLRGRGRVKRALERVVYFFLFLGQFSLWAPHSWDGAYDQILDERMQIWAGRFCVGRKCWSILFFLGGGRVHNPCELVVLKGLHSPTNVVIAINHQGTVSWELCAQIWKSPCWRIHSEIFRHKIIEYC